MSYDVDEKVLSHFITTHRAVSQSEAITSFNSVHPLVHPAPSTHAPPLKFCNNLHNQLQLKQPADSPQKIDRNEEDIREIGNNGCYNYVAL